MNCNLSGTGVLVTRAAHQAEPLCDLIEAHGGKAVRFPVLEIRPLQPAALPESVSSSDIIIFISPNAARCGMVAIGGIQRLVGRTIAAVGKMTARTLEAAGLTVSIVPQGEADSEALLAHPELQQVNGKRIVIIRGEGGRALLGDTLIQRGADLSYVEVYQRRCPAVDSAPLLKQWHEIQVVTSTSIDMLNNLLTLLGEEGLQLLRQTPLLVISPRMQQRARELGIKKIILADGAGDKAILTALCEWKRQLGACME